MEKKELTEDNDSVKILINHGRDMADMWKEELEETKKERKHFDNMIIAICYALILTIALFIIFMLILPNPRQFILNTPVYMIIVPAVVIDVLLINPITKLLDKQSIKKSA